jgi:hypothetical protein
VILPVLAAGFILSAGMASGTVDTVRETLSGRDGKTKNERCERSGSKPIAETVENQAPELLL